MRKNEPTGDKLFDIFWDKYPRKESKPKALNWFRKNKVTPEISTVPSFFEETQRDAEEFNNHKGDFKDYDCKICRNKRYIAKADEEHQHMYIEE